MEQSNRTYIAIDLKSFYASVECVERGLDPLSTNLVVADESRTDKTICLAVSPSLKSYGIGGRARLFEAVQKVRQVNYARQMAIPDHRFRRKSSNDTELREHPDWELDFIRAVPRMEHIPADKDRVRIAELDEMSYRRQLWDHKPLTSFWRVGRGIADKLAMFGIDTMGRERECVPLYGPGGADAEDSDSRHGLRECSEDYRLITYTNKMSAPILIQPVLTHIKRCAQIHATKTSI